MWETENDRKALGHRDRSFGEALHFIPANLTKAVRTKVEPVRPVL